MKRRVISILLVMTMPLSCMIVANFNSSAAVVDTETSAAKHRTAQPYSGLRDSALL